MEKNIESIFPKIYLEKPTPEDIEILKREFNINPRNDFNSPKNSNSHFPTPLTQTWMLELLTILKKCKS